MICDNFDEVQRRLFRRLSTDPDFECAPRGQKIKEALGVTFELTDPRARLTSSVVRNAQYGFAAGEFLWYLRGARDLESIAYYNPRMREFSDDGATMNSAYGYRLRVENRLDYDTRGVLADVGTQWNDVARTIVADHDSRRAVMAIYSPGDLRTATSVGSKDVPCTLALQFFVRERRLHLHVTMRSNDMVWGLANDLFSFTLLQEAMLLDLRHYDAFSDLELGSYFHTAGSMHLYERHFEMAEKALVEWAKPAEPMPAIRASEDLDALARDEVSLRTTGALAPDHGTYGGGAAWLLMRLLEHRAKVVAKAAK